METPNQTTAPTLMNNSDLSSLVKQMRIKCLKDNTHILERIKSETTLTGKCILARNYLAPQSNIMEQIIKKDLEIGNAPDKSSGDGSKNGKNFEIKFSAHDKNGKFNWVQFRPDHNIDYYILIGYNLFEGTLGKAYNFKVPAEDLYQLIIDYGGYAHGCQDILGVPTKDNLKGRDCEYAIRVNPNVLVNKSKELWDKLQTYITPYHKDQY